MKVFRSLAAAVLFGAGLVAHAATDEATARAFLRNSGIWDQLGPDLAQSVQAEIARHRRGPASAQDERMASRVAEAFAPERMRAVALAVITSDGDPASIQAATAWALTPLGKRLAEAGKNSAADRRPPHVQARDGAALLASIPAAKRALLERYVVASGLADGLASITGNVLIALRVGAACAVDCSRLPSPEALRKIRDDQLPGMRAVVLPLALAMLAPAVASVSDADLVDCIAQVETPAGRHVVDLAVKAVDAVFSDSALQLGRTIPGTRDAANP